jgi:hypothetical protein
LKYLKDGERQLEGSGDEEQKCVFGTSGNGTSDSASPVIIVINEIPK